MCAWVKSEENAAVVQSWLPIDVLECPAGSFVDGITCKECAAGSSSMGGKASACELCVPGTDLALPNVSSLTARNSRQNQCLWRTFLPSLGFLSVQECSKANLHSSVASAATNWVASTKSWQVERAAASVPRTRSALSESYPGHPSKLASVKRVRRLSMRTGMRIVGACISLMVARYAGYFSTLGLPGTVEETLASAIKALA